MRSVNGRPGSTHHGSCADFRSCGSFPSGGCGGPSVPGYCWWRIRGIRIDGRPCLSDTTDRRPDYDRRPASHVRYDSGDTPSRAAHAACDFTNAIRHSRSVRGSTTSHHAIGAGRRKARCWRSRTSVSQSSETTGHSVRFTFAEGIAQVGAIGEFFVPFPREG